MSLLKSIDSRLEILVAAAPRQAETVLSPDDRRALGALLGSIDTGKPGSMNFTCKEAATHAENHPALCDALSPVIGAFGEPGTARRLGKLLARGEGVVINDLLVCRCGKDRDGVLWQLTRMRMRV